MSTHIPDDSIAAPAAEASRCVAREVTVLNPYGVHIRPAAELTELAHKFQSLLHLVVDGRPFEAGAIIEVLAANLQYGKRFTLVAEGNDAGDAIAALEEFFGRLARDQSEAAQLIIHRRRQNLPGEKHLLNQVASGERLGKAA